MRAAGHAGHGDGCTQHDHVPARGREPVPRGPKAANPGWQERRQPCEGGGEEQALTATRKPHSGDGAEAPAGLQGPVHPACGRLCSRGAPCPLPPPPRGSSHGPTDVWTPSALGSAAAAAETAGLGPWQVAQVAPGDGSLHLCGGPAVVVVTAQSTSAGAAQAPSTQPARCLPPMMLCPYYNRWNVPPTSLASPRLPFCPPSHPPPQSAGADETIRGVVLCSYKPTWSWAPACHHACPHPCAWTPAPQHALTAPQRPSDYTSSPPPPLPGVRGAVPAPDR